MNKEYIIGVLAGSKCIIEHGPDLYINKTAVHGPVVDNKNRYIMNRLSVQYADIKFVEDTNYDFNRCVLSTTNNEVKNFTEYKVEVFPEMFDDDEKKLDFVKGVFEGSGYVRNNVLYFDTKHLFVKEYIKKLFNGKESVTPITLLYFDCYTAVDIVNKLCVPNSSKYDTFMNVLVPGLIKIKCIRTLPNAVIPSKVRISDSGFDLTAVALLKKVGDVSFYDTGISIVPVKGYYFKVYPRSSISKTGYMLANGVGVIDETYTGNVIIAMRKINSSVPDFELPCKIVQLIPEKNIYSVIEESFEEIEETSRGSGGFGSTDVPSIDVSNNEPSTNSSTCVSS